jgi:sec-independent protein translocase protein TatB
MFDIGFPELMLISIVALLVIGPDQLPQAIRTLSLWIGRIRRSFANIRLEIEKEIGADEIRAQLHNESIMQDLEQSKSAITDASAEISNAVHTTRDSVMSQVNTLADAENSDDRPGSDSPVIDGAAGHDNASNSNESGNDQNDGGRKQA